MFFKPTAHLLVGPRPFKGMGVEAIVFRFCSLDMVHEFLTTVPRTTLPVVKLKGTVQHLRLMEPRSMNRSEARPPPSMTLVEIGSRRGSRVAGVAILDQIYSCEPTMPATERCQSLRVMKRVFFLQKNTAIWPV
jgi:hypothetical protein